MITLKQVSWRAGAFHLEGIDLAVPAGAYAVLMGRTGSGKTSLLEMICGLRRPASGRVEIAGVDVTDVPPGERGLGYVPQDAALFPTMTVAQQLGFALKVRRKPKREIEQRVAALAAELDISHLLDRLPQALSGGERQRVALGRALAAQPKALLLDEPLSAVDEAMRDELVSLLKRTQHEHHLTALHVTHSRTEAEQLADLHFHLRDGRIEKGPFTKTV